MSNYQSSSTLRNSVPTWSFGQTKRFSHCYKEPMVHNIYDLPEIKARRTCSFGVGFRRLFNNLDKSPSPQKYNLRSSLEIGMEKGKGPKLVAKVPIIVKLYLYRNHRRLNIQDQMYIM
jgi:hypothetical protein